MTLESKENYPRHTKIVQNSLGFMPEVKPLHKPRGDLVLCARKLVEQPDLPSLAHAGLTSSYGATNVILVQHTLD